MSGIYWIWLAAAVIFLIIELMTPSLLFICFVVGSVVAGAFSYFSPEQYYWQIGIFLLVSISLIPPTRTLAKRMTKPSAQKSNVDALIGKTGKVIKVIDLDDGGKVQIGGEIWIAGADRVIEEGKRIKVVSVSGARLHVEPSES
jgi:membrane protein implicated in regulation of membrane protease activity